MKLDASFVRYLGRDDYRVLAATEVGSKNHEIVPTTLIATVAKMRSMHRILGELCKRTLLAREASAGYDGYRLTYGGYDYLALHTFSARSTVSSVGHQLGTGKESDVYLVAGPDQQTLVLKIQRLGRQSFRSVRTNRDYGGNGRKMRGASWMYLSRLAAQREWAFMQALYQRRFPVPRPVDHNRHCIVMELISGRTLGQVHIDERFTAANVASLFDELMQLVIRLAEHGLIHGDFNEFNLILEDGTGRIVMIDFPQMVSTCHQNAKFYFDRDVKCIVDFFEKRFNFIPEAYPDFNVHVEKKFDLDVELLASGFLKPDLDGGLVDDESLEAMMDDVIHDDESLEAMIDNVIHDDESLEAMIDNVIHDDESLESNDE